MILSIRLSVIVVITICFVTKNSYGLENSESEGRDWKPLVNKFTRALILKSRNSTEERREPEKSDGKAVEEGRKKHKFLYPGFGLLGLGGYHAALALLALKVKAFLVGIFLIAAFFYWSKWKGFGFGLGTTCPEPFFGGHDFTPYHSSDVVSYSDPSIHTHTYDYSSSGYSNPSYVGASYAGAGYSDASSGYSDGVTYSKPPPGAEVVSASADPTASHYKRRRRVGSTDRQKRSVPSAPRQNNLGQQTTGLDIDFTNLIFMFLNVNTNECRKRFVCEVDYLARSDMFIQFGYKMLGPKLFQNYRSLDGGKVKNLRQCSSLYPDCKTPHESFAEKASDIDIETTTQPPIPTKQKKLKLKYFFK